MVHFKEKGTTVIKPNKWEHKIWKTQEGLGITALQDRSTFRKRRPRELCFVRVWTCCLRNLPFHTAMCLKSSWERLYIPISLNFPAIEEAAGHAFPSGSCYLPQILSRLIIYLFYLMQISSLLSFLNSRSCFGTGSWRQENASRTNNNHSNTKRNSIKNSTRQCNLL